MRSRREMEPNANHSPVERPWQHFFKIILPSTIDEKKLRIPDKFVRKFGDELSDVANFMVPNGCAWKVGLTKDQNGIWFDDGWHNFVEHYYIRNGYFLVFGYRGFSNFSVLILDVTACEIEYPQNGEGSIYGEKCLVHHQIEMENNDSIQISGSTLLSPYCFSLKSKVCGESVTKGESSRRHNRQLQNPGRKKQHRGVASMVNPYDKHLCDTRSKKIKMEELLEIANVDANEPGRGKLDEHTISNSHGPLVKINDSNISKVELGDNELLAKCEEDVEIITSEMFGFKKASPESEKAIQAARMFKPKSPSFMVLLRPYNCYNNILVSDGREWIVRLAWKGCGRVDFGGGWNAFCRENNLQGGEVCVFELISSNVLKTSMFRAVQDVRPEK
ncbi:B3 domain-containing transcription factor VRN1 isoform X2 [Hevea brasiliensis]|uniref:B3 domain-containing transcription factor VRN1 isoform X2 n=1 Tax=Hevea brasiliensis TaxID=3981 RepID=UPI0025FD65B8|nr:B3 domain-containing transcription factor VRN1 isoform X2 [Hevea brasiliensis]